MAYSIGQNFVASTKVRKCQRVEEATQSPEISASPHNLPVTVQKNEEFGLKLVRLLKNHSLRRPESSSSNIIVAVWRLMLRWGAREGKDDLS